MASFAANSSLFSSCSSSTVTYNPYCTAVYNSSVSRYPKFGDLPDIIITIGMETITIPPYIYVEGASAYNSTSILDTTVSFNIMAVDNSLLMDNM